MLAGKIGYFRATAHPEALGWRTRVIANGGSVSATTFTAVETFCRAIDTAGIRDRFFRLNLFAGTGLAAALVPLYRGQSLGGTQFGNTADTNINFVSGDYTETGTSGGLNSGASNSTKYLQSGFNAFNAGLSHNNSHISWYSRSQITANATISGGYASVGGVNITWQVLAFGGINLMYYRSGGDSNSGIEAVSWSGANRSGHGIAQRNSGGGVLYRNGTNLNVTSTTTNANTWTGSFGQQYVYARQINGGADQYFAGNLQGYSLGLALTNAQASAFSSAMIAFQTALSRN